MESGSYINPFNPSQAGRDMRASRCVLYYSRKDGEAVRYMASKAQASREKKAAGGVVASAPKKSVEDVSAKIGLSHLLLDS